MRFRTFIAFLSYQNLRSLLRYLSIPLCDLAPTAMPPKPNVAARVCAGKTDALHFPFPLNSTHLFVAYLSRNRVSQTYKYPCARLAEQQAIVAQVFRPSRVCAGQSSPFPSFPFFAQIRPLADARSLLAVRTPIYPTARSQVFGSTAWFFTRFLSLPFFLELTRGHDVCHSPH